MTFLLAIGLSVGGFVVPSLPLAPPQGSVHMTASPAFAGVLQPGQSLLVSGTVTNNTGEPLDVGTATVHISPTKILTRKALSHWLDDDSSPIDSLLGAALGETRIGELAVGQTRFFSISVPAAKLGFMTGNPGVFPLETRLATQGVNFVSQRSAVSWFPTGVTPQINLAIAAPLNAPASTSGLLDAELLDTLTAPGGELYNQLTMYTRHPVALGVDPMIVASVRVLGESASQSAQDWLQLLEAAPNDLFLLSYADSDQLLLHRAGVTAPLGPISFPHDEVVEPEPGETVPPDTPPLDPASSVTPEPGSPAALRTTIDSLAWPAQGVQSNDDLDYLAAGGYTRTLISSSEVSGYVVGSSSVTMGEHKTTVSDDDISALLHAAAIATSESEWAQAAAGLTATLALSAAQSPGGTVVATLPRDANPSSQMIDSALRSIESLPWISTIPLSQTLSAPPVSGSLNPLEDESGDVDRVALTKDLVKMELALTDFSSVADDPTLVTGPQRLQLLALTSTMWDDAPLLLQAAVEESIVQSTEILASVHLPESSSINLLQEKGNLPIAVRNELDFPVTVYVNVRPERAILRVNDSHVKLTIEANSQAKASVPVESIANGEVRTTVSLSSETGVQISQPKIVVLNVQAGWETTASVVLAAIVIALFIAGVWRTVLRRRAVRAAPDSGKRETS